jgi:4-hydroxy-tetrahydrodipicolinate reductase
MAAEAEMAKLRVLVVGAAGRMGSELVRAIAQADDMVLVGAVDYARVGEDAGAVAGILPTGVIITDSLGGAIAASSPDVAVDFTLPACVAANVRTALKAGLACVVGATGLAEENLAEIAALCEERGRPAFVAPNFAIGAVLMMQFAAQAARHFSAAEIVELHHPSKADAPSGTALRTAKLMGEAMAEAKGGGPAGWQETSSCPTGVGKPARGQAEGRIHIHSVRLPGLVAHQEVIFGGLGETLTIRHDSTSRESFMPGVLLAIRKVRGLKGLVVGLEKLL